MRSAVAPAPSTHTTGRWPDRARSAAVSREAVPGRVSPGRSPGRASSSGPGAAVLGRVSSAGEPVPGEPSAAVPASAAVPPAPDTRSAGALTRAGPRALSRAEVASSVAPAWRPSISAPDRGTPPRSAAMTPSSGAVTPGTIASGRSMPSWMVSGVRQTSGYRGSSRRIIRRLSPVGGRTRGIHPQAQRQPRPPGRRSAPATGIAAVTGFSAGAVQTLRLG